MGSIQPNHVAVTDADRLVANLIAHMLTERDPETWSWRTVMDMAIVRGLDSLAKDFGMSYAALSTDNGTDTTTSRASREATQHVR